MSRVDAYLRRGRDIVVESPVILSTLKKTGLNHVARRTYRRMLHRSSITPITVDGYTAEFFTATADEAYSIKQTLGSERPILECFTESLVAGDTVYDIGANVGGYAIIGAKAQPDATIFAFEPHPVNKERLSENLELNNLQNVHIRDYALGDSDGTIKLKTESNEPGVGTHTIVASDTGNSIEIDIRRAESAIKNDDIPSPDVMKIDVEGAELDVLKGFNEVLESCRVIIIEIHPTKIDTTVEDVRSLLIEAGFTTSEVQERDETTHLFAQQDDK